jgi:HlyD family secretion protein
LRVVQESAGAVTPGTPLLELANLDELEIVADLLTADAVQLRPGGTARIVFREGSEPLAGRLRLVEPAAFTKVSALGVEEQRVNAVVDIVAPRERWNQLGDGYRVDVHFVLSQRTDAVKVPAGALFRDGGGWAVFTVTGGKAQRRRVDGVLRSGAEAMVERGLQPGESVVLFPGDRVKDGARVRPR